MKTAKTILVCYIFLFIELLIGGSILRDDATAIASFILLFVDVVVCLILEHLIKTFDDEYDTDNEHQIPTMKKVGIVFFVLQGISLFSSTMYSTLQGEPLLGTSIPNTIGRFVFAIIGTILIIVSDVRRKKVARVKEQNNPLSYNTPDALNVSPSPVYNTQNDKGEKDKQNDDENDSNNEDDTERARINFFLMLIFAVPFIIGMIALGSREDDLSHFGESAIIACIGTIVLFIAQTIFKKIREKKPKEQENEAPPSPPQQENVQPQTDLPPTTETKEPTDQEKFLKLYGKLKLNGGIKFTRDFINEEECLLLIDICKRMPHAPNPHFFIQISSISAESFGGKLVLVYGLRYRAGSIGENVFILLTIDQNNSPRIFTLETHFDKYSLCEYRNGSHLNYGSIELQALPDRMNDILWKS